MFVGYHGGSRAGIGFYRIAQNEMGLPYAINKKTPAPDMRPETGEKQSFPALLKEHGGASIRRAAARCRVWVTA